MLKAAIQHMAIVTTLESACVEMVGLELIVITVYLPLNVVSVIEENVIYR